MASSKRGGKGGRAGAKGGREESEGKGELQLKELDQEYATALKALGDGRFSLKCFDGKERIGKVRGKLKKGHHKKWINAGDLVLVGLRGFQDGTCDIIDKYTVADARRLKAQKELPEDTVIGATSETKGEECVFDFEAI